jgi:hypothetical protein
MSGQRIKWRPFLFLPLLVFTAAAAAPADQTQSASYVVQGPAGAALWGLGDRPGTEAVIFAFSQLAPVKGSSPATPPAKDNPPAPGPRVAFSVTQWTMANGDWVLSQWYGDAPLTEKALAITGDLAQGKLEATVPGTLVQQSASGTVVRRDVPGLLEVQWVASSSVANATTADTYQTPAYAAILQTAGTGRAATATARVTVEALGAPIQLWGLGSLSSVVSGLLSVTMQ